MKTLECPYCGEEFVFPPNTEPKIPEHYISEFRDTIGDFVCLGSGVPEKDLLSTAEGIVI